MINSSFFKILAASEEEKRDLFMSTANRLGIPIQNVEKDFWVCLVLDLLFNGRDDHATRMLFKGGTSLSKAHGIISRFSEDIDITIFREDLELGMTIEELEKVSGKQRRKYFDKIKDASQKYICDQLSPYLQNYFIDSFKEIDMLNQVPKVEVDLTDISQQTLLINYHSINDLSGYVRPTVKIEGGAKSALDPHGQVTIFPYISDDIKDLPFAVENVLTIEADRTFWDKIIILHGIRRWFDIKGELRQEGHRYSRHYYDVYQLLKSEKMQKVLDKKDLAIDCARYARMFFNSTSLDLKTAYPGSFSIMPSSKMVMKLKQDYRAMSGMIFGVVPDFDEILETVSVLEKELNKSQERLEVF